MSSVSDMLEPADAERRALIVEILARGLLRLKKRRFAGTAEPETPPSDLTVPGTRASIVLPVNSGRRKVPER